MNTPLTIGKYAITRTLGKGAMGVIYEGFDEDIQRRVAIKTLSPSVASDEMANEFISRCKIEAQAAARCMHPNIVTILEYGVHQEKPFIVMEYIEGKPLTDILKREPNLKFNRLLKIFSQVLKGLHFAHHSNVIHRDMKPANIMVLKNDVIKITDFGIARLPKSGVTQIGYSVGTPKYMAPEQERTSEVDCRADLFALAVILQEMLAKVQVSQKIKHGTLSPQGIYITPKVNMNQSVPIPLLAVLQQGLAENPNERFKNVQAFASALKHAVSAMRTDAGGKVDSPNQPPALRAAPLEYRHNQLKEMRQRLVHFIGPIGNELMDLYGKEKLTINDLALKLAEEIPDERERAQFLASWVSDDELTEFPQVSTQRMETRSAQETRQRQLQKGPPTIAPRRRGLHLRQTDLIRVENLFAQYVGPMAEILIEEHMEASEGYEDFIEKLLESIPNDSEKTDFRIKLKRALA